MISPWLCPHCAGFCRRKCPHLQGHYSRPTYRGEISLIASRTTCVVQYNAIPGKGEINVDIQEVEGHDWNFGSVDGTEIGDLAGQW